MQILETYHNKGIYFALTSKNNEQLAGMGRGRLLHIDSLAGSQAASVCGSIII